MTKVIRTSVELTEEIRADLRKYIPHGSHKIVVTAAITALLNAIKEDRAILGYLMTNEVTLRAERVDRG